jgi:hypothetical protein
MAIKEPSGFICPLCGEHCDRQHWGVTDDLTKYQDLLTCSDPKCPFNRFTNCSHHQEGPQEERLHAERDRLAQEIYGEPFSSLYESHKQAINDRINMQSKLKGGEQ